MCKVSPVFRQFMTVICCNLLSFSFGVSSGWGGINFVELQSENSTFPTGPLTPEQSALVISLPYAGCVIGNFVIAPLSQAIGIKRTIHLIGLPTFLSALLIVYAKDVYYLYLSRFLTGLVGGGSFVAIPLLISDISFDHVRGALNSLIDPFYNSGIIFSFFLGNYLNCLDQAKVQLIMPVIFMIMLFLLPESPGFWTKQHNPKRANESRKFYKGSSIDPENVEFIPKSTKKQLENETIFGDESESSCFERWTPILKSFGSRHAIKAFSISFTVLIFGYLCGSVTIVVYITDIFSITGSPLSEKNSSILISVTTLIGNLVLLNIVERFNRRTLQISSALLTAVCYSVFGVYCTFWLKQPEYEWVPPLCLVCIIFSSCMGLITIPYIITNEIFPKEIRQMSIGMAISLAWIVLFVYGYIFPFGLSGVGLSTCMFILSGVCVLNAIFGALLIPETRGKSYEEIEALLSK